MMSNYPPAKLPSLPELNPEKWQEVCCEVCKKTYFCRKSEIVRGLHSSCSRKCSSIKKFGHHKIDADKRKEIIQYAEEFGTVKAGIKFGVSRYFVANIAEWSREKKAKVLAIEAEKGAADRKKREAIRAKRYRTKEGMPERLQKRNREYRMRRVFRECQKRHSGLKAWDFWRIAKRQRLKCYYSALPLTRETISVEHIVPQSAGGKTDMENVVFVHLWVNKMKLDRSLSEFRKMIETLSDSIKGGTFAPTLARPRTSRGRNSRKTFTF